MQNLSDEKLSKLKCSKCNNLLSVPPISISIQGDIICGRCPISVIGITRLLIYEVLAQEFSFPCQNEKFGCDLIVKWDEVRQHEKNCTKRPYLCPVSSSTNCFWRGPLKEITQHLYSEHLFNMKDINVVKIKVKSTLPGCKLFMLNKKKYLFNVNFNNTKKMLELALVQLEHEEKLDKYRFKLFSEDLSKQILLPIHPIFSYALKRSIETQAGNTISEDVISYISDETFELFCEIMILNSNTEEKPKEIPKESTFISNILECPVCNEFMRAPIFQCRTGHSFCFTCTPALKNCPLCREGMLKTRNFALEDIANQHVVDCCHKSLGCDFKGFPGEVRKHQTTCRIVNCSVDGCLWTGSEVALNEHAKAHEEKKKISENKTNVDSQVNSSRSRQIRFF